MREFFNKLKRININRNLKKIKNTMIIIGGDDISEYYGIEALENELKKIKEKE